MKIIVGLGNPGSEYMGTRHNFGFAVLDGMAAKAKVGFKPSSKFKADVARYVSNEGEDTLLVNPTTYMNNSGEAVLKVLNYYDIPVSNLTIIYDDIDLNLGEYRETGKSSAGHKGVQSIIDFLKTDDIARIRLGIMNQETKTLPTEVFVLQKFSKTEQPIKDNMVEKLVGLLGL
jgi:PTH1 family peptidyl-tRNA hydrolase